ALIDWRRSASSDHLYVREREWEAAHTVWLWPNLSATMGFHSHLSEVAKVERAVVLVLALSELLSRAGERIALMDGAPPSSGRGAVRRLAETIMRHIVSDDDSTMPRDVSLSRFSECVLFSDFLDPPDSLARDMDRIAAQGVRGHLVQVLDPAEETLPYAGRTEFRSSSGGVKVLAGRAETLRERYQERIADHRSKIMEHVRRLEWTFLVHHTDRPAEEALLKLHSGLAGLERHYRYRPAGSTNELPLSEGGSS
ncbi:MAG: DUF58 domain-containing protein, partial [bacterium]|nr:DUF58 domain-containing protein [bacterium]